MSELKDEIKKFEKEKFAIIEHAEKLTIRTEGDLAPIADFKKECSLRTKKLDEIFKPHIKKAHEAHKSLVKELKDLKAPFENAVSIVNETVNNWSIEQERIRQEEQRKLEEKARREEEKRRKELEEQARKWEEKGNIEKAQERLEQAEMVIAEPVIIETPPTTIKTESGAKITRIKDFDVIIQDKKKALEYILQTGALNTIDISESKIKKFFKALDMQTAPEGFIFKTKFIIKG